MSDPIAETTTAPTLTELDATHFRVNWEIDIESDTGENISAVEAALKTWVENFQGTYGSPSMDVPCTFTLTPINGNTAGEPITIDLAEHA